MASKTVTRKFGWKPDVPDCRDLEFCKVMRPLRAGKLPPVVDLRAGCSPVEDQGQLGSCTANALVGNLEFLLLKDKIPYTDLSRLFVYYNERAIEGTVTEDSGAMIRDGVKTLAKQGVCAEAVWPYATGKFTVKPTAACYKDGLKRVITQYARLNTMDDMRNCLAAGYPFVFGFSVYSSFMSAVVAKTGDAPMPTKKDTLQGGHAVLCVGYDDVKKKWLVRNSWGCNFGMKGYFTLPQPYLVTSNGAINTALADDFWSIRAGSSL